MKILAIIPARGGSKGVPRKNVRPLAGKPLIAYTIEAARSASSLDRIVVSTEDDEIAAVSRSIGAEVVARPPALAGDETTTLAVLQQVVSKLAEDGYCPDAVMTLQPTSPLRSPRHIDEAAALFEADKTADSLVSCMEVPHIFHPLSVMRRNPEGYLEPFATSLAPSRRQDKEPVFARNGAAIYLTRTDKLSQFIFGGRLIPYYMDQASSIDIDGPEDFVAAEQALLEKP